MKELLFGWVNKPWIEHTPKDDLFMTIEFFVVIIVLIILFAIWAGKE